MFTRPLSLTVGLCLLAFQSVFGQTSPPTTTPQAAALAAKVLQAVEGNTAVTDITFQANANFTAGSDHETGTATLVARGNGESLVTLNLTDGQRQEIRNGIQGVWAGTDSTPHNMGSHNCFTDADWFYPALTLAALARDPTLVISLVGEESRGGEPVYHLLLNRDADPAH
jgi:hypothetical protein